MRVYNDIEVLCHCFNKGNINPIRIKIIEDNSIILTIDKILTTHISNYNGNPIKVFKCESLIRDKIFSYELHYEIHNCIWRLFLK